MIKQVLLGSAVLSAVTVAGIPSAFATSTDYTATPVTAVDSTKNTNTNTTDDTKNYGAASNQGNTTIEFTGDFTTSDGWKNPNADGTGTSKDDVTNTAGNNGLTAGGLTLRAVPSFDFGTGAKANPLQAITKNAAHYPANGTSTYDADAPVDAIKNGIEVSDTRGGDTGYQILAAASSLYNAKGQELPVSSLKVTIADGALDNGTNGQIKGTTATEIFHKEDGSTVKFTEGAATTQSTTDKIAGGTKDADNYGAVAGFGNLIATGNADTNGVFTTGAASATLDINGSKIKANVYSGIITYTLQDANLSAAAQ